jgi:hypothetical protein
LSKGTNMVLSRVIGLVCVMQLAVFHVNGQAVKQVQSHEIQLLNGPRIVAPNASEWQKVDFWKDFDRVNDFYYGLIQVERIPSSQKRQEMQRDGIELLEYIPHHTYYARIRVGSSVLNHAEQLRSIFPLPAEAKVAPDLWERPLPEGNYDAGRILVRVYAHNPSALEFLREKFPAQNAIFNYKSQDGRWAGVWLEEGDLEWMSQQPEVRYIELYPTEGEPDDTHGRSLHRVNRIQGSHAPLGSFTGEGVEVIVRDDGIVGPHIDFKGRLDQRFAFNDDPARGHGDGVSGIVCGAGNLDPDNAGMAVGSKLHVLNYRQDLEDQVLFLHTSEGAVVVSTSYSDGCNRGYTGNARTIDEQTWQNPSLLHVFSAGNSNNNSCGYGAGDQWGNVTGGHKMGKNAIATANVFYNGIIVSSSSRGPAHDGRLKPEITAYGQGQISTFHSNTYGAFGGTSAAAPGISGSAACLYQAYKEFNSGEVPDAALIKAVMLNSANDLGNPGPDYRFGFGSINAYRALQILEKEQFQPVEVDNGQSISIPLELDRSARSVRVMVYWTDFPGSQGTSRALVNDLDLTVKGPDQTIFYPYILDHTADPILLDKSAVPGVDHLNNVEQVQVFNAEAGTYEIEVNGFEVPLGAVKAWVVYDIEYDEVELAYPAGGEALEPGSTEAIRWEAPADTNAFVLSFSTDMGMNWTNIARVSRLLRTYDWIVPATSSGQILLRLRREDGVEHISEPFSIYAKPEIVEVYAACPEYITVRVLPIPGAQQYHGYLLGDMYMERVATSEDTLIQIPVESPELINWFAVSVEGTDGKKSKRTVASMYNSGLKNCPLDNDLRLTRLVSPTPGMDLICFGEERLVTVEIVNNGQNPQSDFPVFYSVNDGPPVVETFPGTINPGQTRNYTFINAIDPGEARKIEVWLELPENDYTFDDRIQTDLRFMERFDEDLPFVEDFEDFDSLLLTWLVEPSDEQINWQTEKVRQADNSIGFSLMFRNYEYEGDQTEFGVQSGTIDLADLNAPWLFFDKSYSNGDTTKDDQLALEVSIDCGNTYERIVVYSRAELNTWNPIPVEWVPRRSQHWKNDSISLIDFAGEKIILRWVSIPAGGNNIFLDNFYIEEGNTVSDNRFGKVASQFDLIVFPNPISDVLRFKFLVKSHKGAVPVTLISTDGKVVRSELVQSNHKEVVRWDVSELPRGMYLLKADYSEMDSRVVRIVKQ